VSAATDEDGFLVIPTEIDGYRVVQLGDVVQHLAANERRFYRGYRGDERVDRIVVPDGILVEQTFWHRLYLTDYVEFLEREPNLRLLSWSDLRGITWIVPDGSREKYLSRWPNANLIEKSEHIEQREWLYYKLNDVEIALIRLFNLSAVISEGDVLMIPAMLDGFQVTHLGATELRGFNQRLFPTQRTNINRVVIPEGIFVESIFWLSLWHFTNYVEFLAEEPNTALPHRWVYVPTITVIVPDGSRERYFNYFGRPFSVNIIEKSEFNNLQGEQK